MNVILKISLIAICHVLYPRTSTKASNLAHNESRSSLFILQCSYTNKCQLRGCAETISGSKNRQLIPITPLIRFSCEFETCSDSKVESFASRNVANGSLKKFSGNNTNFQQQQKL